MTTHIQQDEVSALSEDFLQKIQTAKDLRTLNGLFSEFFADKRFANMLAYAESSRKHWKNVKKALRNSLAPIYKESGVWYHSLSKPFGYPGDFAVLEHVYDQKVHKITQSSMGGLIDLWGISRSLPTAVAERKDLLRNYLENQARLDLQDNRVLSIGCGAAREVRELHPQLLEKLKITLLDSDERSIDYALSRLKDNPVQTAIEKVIANGVSDDLEAVLHGQQYDLVYSFGVLDYLPEKYAVRLIENMKKTVKPDGKILFCIKDCTKFDAWFYDWFYDWRFVDRTRKDGAELAERCGLEVTREFSVSEGVIIIYECVFNSL
jgi:extracellular factor (EF) 3-hydroxypalmitic acid methyl ester biosynthesis protein